MGFYTTHEQRKFCSQEISNDSLNDNRLHGQDILWKMSYTLVDIIGAVSIEKSKNSCKTKILLSGYWEILFSPSLTSIVLWSMFLSLSLQQWGFIILRYCCCLIKLYSWAATMYGQRHLSPYENAECWYCLTQLNSGFFPKVGFFSSVFRYEEPQW